MEETTVERAPLKRVDITTEQAKAFGRLYTAREQARAALQHAEEMLATALQAAGFDPAKVRSGDVNGDPHFMVEE